MDSCRAQLPDGTGNTCATWDRLVGEGCWQTCDAECDVVTLGLGYVGNGCGSPKDLDAMLATATDGKAPKLHSVAAFKHDVKRVRHVP